jgi:hypothetical protein
MLCVGTSRYYFNYASQQVAVWLRFVTGSHLAMMKIVVTIFTYMKYIKLKDELGFKMFLSTPSSSPYALRLQESQLTLYSTAVTVCTICFSIHISVT